MINNKTAYKQFENNNLLWLQDKKNAIIKKNEYSPFYVFVKGFNTERAILNLMEIMPLEYLIQLGID